MGHAGDVGHPLRHAFLPRRCAGRRAAGWFAPGAALDAYDRGDLPLVLPTLKHFEAILEFGDAAQLLATSQGRDLDPIRPQVIDGRIVLPGETGYVV